VFALNGKLTLGGLDFQGPIRGSFAPILSVEDRASALSSAALSSMHGDSRHRPTVVPHTPAACLLQEHEGPAAGFGE
jgi:hypothetical protein